MAAGQSLIQDLNPVAGTASTTLTNEIPVDLVAYADASLLRRVFQNLVANAIQYTPRGQVVIGARDSTAARPSNAGFATMAAGFPPSGSTSSSTSSRPMRGATKAAGLGLAIVKTFVEAHGGEVTVESQEGLGSTFTFRLPHSARNAGRNG